MHDQVTNTTVLLAEDEPIDVLLVRRAFEKSKIPNPLKVVSNGEEAIRYLDGKEPYADRRQWPWPGLLLLDLKMPRKDGWDVLSWLQEQGGRDLTVVILSSSNLGSDRERAKRLGATDYRVKPMDFKSLVRLTEELRECWLKPRCAQI